MLKSIVLTVGGLLVAALAVVLIFAATRPSSFRIQRTASINAPPEKIFPLINDLRRWKSWSPYENRDPDMRRTLSGSETGRGAVYAWEGNGKVGAGRMEIIDAAPPSKIVIKLDFIRPFEGHNTAEFGLAAKAESTDGAWAMYGPSPYMAKLMGIFINMDRMIGDDFATGLANLKRIAEQ